MLSQQSHISLVLPWFQNLRNVSGDAQYMCVFYSARGLLFLHETREASEQMHTNNGSHFNQSTCNTQTHTALVLKTPLHRNIAFFFVEILAVNLAGPL